MQNNRTAQPGDCYHSNFISASDALTKHAAENSERTIAQVVEVLEDIFIMSPDQITRLALKDVVRSRSKEGSILRNLLAVCVSAVNSGGTKSPLSRGVRRESAVS
jgi:hypothetical protein